MTSDVISSVADHAIYLGKSIVLDLKGVNDVRNI
jgi:hypothetical protein